MGRTVFVIGIGIGYVLGSRAGRQRYDDIVRVARQVRDHPAVQSAAGLVGGQASDLASRVRDQAGQALHSGKGLQVGHVLHLRHTHTGNGAAAHG